MNNKSPLRITAEEIENVEVPQTSSRVSNRFPESTPGGQRSDYGTLHPEIPLSDQRSRTSLLNQAWFYLGLAGMTGAFVSWAVCEPFLQISASGGGTGVRLMLPLPLNVVGICLGFAFAESLVERSAEKGFPRTLLAIFVGALLGSVLWVLAGVVHYLLTLPFGPIEQASLPVRMTVRAVAWAFFGTAGGIVYGLIGLSARKGLYGVIGGMLGAGIGGALLDPILLATGGMAVSRVFGLTLFGACTGVAIGLVEATLKDRWLYVSGGPLAGKQFVLYKERTTLGSQQSADIYLFKDAAILPAHAAIEIRGGRPVLLAVEPVFLNGRSVRESALKNGDQLQLGRYAFEYLEKRKQAVP